MTYRLLIRRQAQLDVEEVALWYQRRQEGLEWRLLDEYVDLLKRIEKSPRQFPEIASGVRRGLLRVFPYSVYFVLDGQRVEIFAVLHQHSDPGKWRTRL